jgi:hypothetical protein
MSAMVAQCHCGYIWTTKAKTVVLNYIAHMCENHRIFWNCTFSKKNSVRVGDIGVESCKGDYCQIADY